MHGEGRDTIEQLVVGKLFRAAIRREAIATIVLLHVVFVSPLAYLPYYYSVFCAQTIASRSGGMPKEACTGPTTIAFLRQQRGRPQRRT